MHKPPIVHYLALLSVPLVLILGGCCPASSPVSTVAAPTAAEKPAAGPTVTAAPSATIAPAATSTAIPTATEPVFFDGVKITYVGNAGFLIAAGDKKILIDALFRGQTNEYLLPQAIQDALASASPPFEAVDLILVTHNHIDHFEPRLVREHMQANPQAVLVSPQQAAYFVGGLGERVMPVQIEEGERQHLEVGGVSIDAFYISHGIPGLLNLGYLITVNGVKIFHTGDIDTSAVSVSYLQSYGLSGENIDIAFTPHFILSDDATLAYILEGIRPRYVVPMHFAFTGRVDYDSIQHLFPDAVVFHQELESWVMP